MDSLSPIGTFPLQERVRQPSQSITPERAATLRTDVEGLRAVAIILVVAFHAGVQGITGGFVGVDVFYVLSGYLITGLLVKEIRDQARLNLLQFYARRMRRLLPASALVLAVTLIAAALLFAPQEMSFAARGARASALYLSNAFFANIAGDYFGPRVATNPVLHTWSLSVEEQFYLFWPLVILLGLQVCRSMRVLKMAIIGLTALSLAASILLVRHHATFAFYMLPARVWEFGIGALAMLVPANSVPAPRVLSWLGFALIVTSAIVLVPTPAFPGWIALLPVSGTVLTLLAGAQQPQQGAGRLLALPLVQWFGRHSYSWYLWHWPVLTVVAIVLPNSGASGKAAAVAAALVFAALTHHFVENPIRFHPQLAKRPIATLIGGAVITAASFIIATATLHFADRLSALPQIVATTQAANDIATLPRRECISQDGEEQLKACSFGNLQGSVSVVLFGDSHAIPWSEPLRHMTERNGWKLTTYLKSGCAAADFSFEPNPVLAAQCSRWRARVVENILRTHPSLVFLGSGTNRLGRPIDPTRHADAKFTAAVERGTRSTVGTLTSAGIPTLVIRDNPEFTFDVPSCLARSARHAWYDMGSCEMPSAAVLDPHVAAAERTAIRELSNVHYVDFTDHYCASGRCGGVRDGRVVYRDTDHLTSGFAASLEAVLEVEVRAAMCSNDDLPTAAETAAKCVPPRP